MSNAITNILSTLSVFECKVLPVLKKAAHLVYLLTLLMLTFIAEYAPIAGAHLGRIAGRTYRAGKQARAFYDTYLKAQVSKLTNLIEYKARAFMASQLGSDPVYSEARYVLTPSVFVPANLNFNEEVMSATRSELYAFARLIGVSGYNRMKTDDLRNQLLTI